MRLVKVDYIDWPSRHTIYLNVDRVISVGGPDEETYRAESGDVKVSIVYVTIDCGSFQHTYKVVGTLAEIVDKLRDTD